MALINPNTSGDTSATRIAEQRIQEWTMNLDAQRRKQQGLSTEDLKGQIQPYIAISRETGAGGAAVARRVGELLNWEVLHREILDDMAEKFNLPRAMLGMVDETTSNWIIEVFGKWLDPRLVTQTEYIVHLGQLVLLAAQHSNTIFVGRGAQFFLPPDRGLSIYLVAPMTKRIQRVQQLRNCSEADARLYIKETDKGRRQLIAGYFKHDIGDPHLYDLVISMAHTDVDGAAELIVDQCRKRFLS